jgi:hypothetical protein
MLAKSVRPGDVDPQSVSDELRRLLDSPGLQHAESLCQLLRYLVEQSLHKPQEHVKEYQIALEVFGRSESFDPRLDSAVRVQTSRLRNKLIEYYATLGAKDPLTIEIPKGTYQAVFHLRPVEVPAQSAARVMPLPGPRLAERQRLWLAGAAVVPALIVGVLAGSRMSNAPTPPREVRAFWSSVLKSKEAPLVIFSNAEFKGRPESGLRYFDAQSDAQENINDLYTGIGEVLAIDELSRVFRVLNKDMVVKRSGLLSWDETRNRDLIFAGSPTENLSLRDLPVSEGFVFRPMMAGEPRPGDLAVINAQPRAGEPKLFFASPGLPITEDYAVVTLQRGLHPGQSILLLAGTTTLGTQAAAEFVSQNDHLDALRKRLNLPPGSAYPPFSAVLRVRVARGVPVEIAAVAVHSAGT